MLKHGDAPFLECSTKGDTRFSPFYAKVNGETIEDQYHAAKILVRGRTMFQEAQERTGLTWREAKKLQREGWTVKNLYSLRRLYRTLWEQYIEENEEELIPVLTAATGLSDIFGQSNSPVCQATELWRIRSMALEGQLPWKQEA